MYSASLDCGRIPIQKEGEQANTGQKGPWLYHMEIEARTSIGHVILKT